MRMRVRMRSSESTESGGDDGAAELIELADHQSCSAPSAHTRAVSADSRLYPNEPLLRPPGNEDDSSTVGRLTHRPRSLFNVASSAISATDDIADLSTEFFCDPVPGGSVRRPARRVRGSVTGSARPLSARDRDALGDFGSGLLPTLQEDDGIPADGIPSLEPADGISVDSRGRPRSGSRWEIPSAGTFRTGATWSTERANARDFPVTWPAGDTVRSRRTVDTVRRSVSREEYPLSDYRWWLEPADREDVGTSASLRPDDSGGLLSAQNFDEDDASSSLSPQQTVRLPRNGDDQQMLSSCSNNAEICFSNEYFTSTVNYKLSSLTYLLNFMHSCCQQGDLKIRKHSDTEKISTTFDKKQSR